MLGHVHSHPGLHVVHEPQVGHPRLGYHWAYSQCLSSLPLRQDSLFSFSFCLLLFIYLFFWEIEEGREKEKETSMGCLWHAPNQGPGLQPRHAPWPGIELAIFRFARRCPTSILFYFFKDYIYLFLEGKEGREMSMCGYVSCTRYCRPGPQPRHVPWLVIKPAILWFTGQWSEPHQPGPSLLSIT